MNRIKMLKKKFDERYLFRRFLSDKEILRLQKTTPSTFEPQTVASLTVGCVKIECCLYRASDGLQFGYDVFVKDDPDSDDWIFYDCPNVSVSTKETDMLAALDQVVEQNGLSYTDCCFEKLDGKTIKTGTKTKKDHLLAAVSPCVTALAVRSRK